MVGEVVQLERAITAAKRDPHGGKVMLPLDEAEAILKALKERPRPD